MNKIPMTQAGAEKLKAELQQLKTITRPEVIKAISEARAHGDLKENAEYHAAKEKQSFVEGRIADIEAKLSRAEIIDVTKMENRGKVIFGATVTLINVETDEKTTYQIVGDEEADIKSGRVSISSPIARALISKETGDIAIVQAPAGSIEYEIARVEYL